MFGGVYRGHAVGVGKRNAERYRLSDIAADVSLRADILNVLVVGAERNTAVAEAKLLYCANDILKVFRGAALSRKHKHSGADAVGHLVLCCTLVVGGDAGKTVGAERLSAKPGSVSVDIGVLKGRELIQHLAVSPGHADKIHHLAQPRDVFAVLAGGEFLCREHCAAVLKGSCRHAGRQHDKEIAGQTFRLGEHELKSVGSADIGKLVRIRN